MKIKKLAAFIFSIFVILSFTSCLNILNYKRLQEKSDYTFNISNMPSDCAGMTVRAYSSNGIQSVEENLGTVTDVNETLSNTVSLYSSSSTLEIHFYKDGKHKYYVPVTKNHKNSQTGEYDISGYYCYADISDGNGLNAVMDVSKIQPLEYGKNYNFDTADLPYLIWKATGVKDKSIRFSKSSENNVAIYFFTDLQEFIDGSKENYTTNIYECQEDEIYILICPNYLYADASALISFSLTDVDAEAFLSIKSAVLASNGKLYAFGNNPLNNPRCNLWNVDANSNAMYRVKTFGDEITDIEELDPGFLYVSHGKTLSKVNLATNEITDLAVLDNWILAIENYKDDYVIAVCASDNYKDQVRLVNKTTGGIKNVSGSNETNYLKYINNLLYIPEIDMYVFDTKGISPNDISYLLIDDSDSENLYYLSKDSQYHSSSIGIDGPYTVLDTDSSQGNARVIASGEVYEIDRNKASNADSDIRKTWCESISDVSCIPHKACYILGDNIYYATEEGYHDLFVKKCSKTSAANVLHSKKFSREETVSFFEYNSQLYLVTNSTSEYNGMDSYRIYLHKIDF